MNHTWHVTEEHAVTLQRLINFNLEATGVLTPCEEELLDMANRTINVGVEEAANRLLNGD